MPKMRDTARLAEETVQRAAEVKIRRKTRTARVTTYTLEGYTIPREVLDTALALAGGDISRLRVAKDGSVTVVNKSRRSE